jgi:serine/threonine protein kinase
MGVVWRGHDELLSRDVAVKEVIWPPHLTEQEQQLACRRAIREAQTAGRLSHRNVVRVYDIVEEDGHPCIVMEFLPYESLRDLLSEQGPLPPARAAEIGLGVLGALSAAHAEGILHRDVKPANILVGPDGRVVLTDFGIARATDSPTLTGDGTLLGSPSYIAPERARGGYSGAGAPGDLWGLGASLYAAVEGHPPFERDGALATLTAVVADEPDPAPHAGPLEPVITGLLQKDPERRLGAAEAERLLRRAAGPSLSMQSPLLQSPLLRSPSPAPPPPLPPAAPGYEDLEPWQPAPLASSGRRRSRGFLLALAVLVATAAAVTGLAFVLTSAPGRPAGAPGPGARPATSPGRAQSASPVARGASPARTSRAPAAPPSSPQRLASSGSGSPSGGPGGGPGPGGSGGKGGTGGGSGDGGGHGGGHGHSHGGHGGGEDGGD